jgi:hypothetical protein
MHVEERIDHGTELQKYTRDFFECSSIVMQTLSNIFDLQLSVNYINELEPIMKYDSRRDVM